MARWIPLKEIEFIVTYENDQCVITYVDGTKRSISLLQHICEQEIGRELMQHEQVFSKDGWGSGNYKLDNIGLLMYHPEYPLVLDPPQIAEPYVFKRAHKQLDTRTGRLYVRVFDFNNRRLTTSYSRHVYQIALGRRLIQSEEIDHIDNNHTNDVFSNFQILSRKQNTDKAALSRGYRVGDDMYGTYVCPHCNESFTRLKRLVKVNELTFCSYNCNGKYYQNQRFPNGPRMITLPCAQCGKLHDRKLGKYNSQTKQGITKFFCGDPCFRASKRKQ